MQMLLQHQVPPYFQRVRHYGLHAGITYKKIKDKLPDHLKRNGQTVRTIIQLLKALLAEEPYLCSVCGGIEFEERPINQDIDYLALFIPIKKRGPPNNSRMGSLIN